MVIDLLGPDLEELFNDCGRKFSLKTVLLLADQLITLLESVHNTNYIHRDIKPDIFLMGVGKRVNQVHIIDFGLAMKYRDAETRSRQRNHSRLDTNSAETVSNRIVTFAALVRVLAEDRSQLHPAP